MLRRTSLLSSLEDAPCPGMRPCRHNHSLRSRRLHCACHEASHQADCLRKPCTHAAQTGLTEGSGAWLDGVLLPVQPGPPHGLAWSGTQGCHLSRAQVHALRAAAGAITIFAQVIVQKVDQAVSRQCSGCLAPILHAAHICAAHLVWVGSGWAGGDVWGLRLQGCSMRDQVEESQHCFKSWLQVGGVPGHSMQQDICGQWGHLPR